MGDISFIFKAMENNGVKGGSQDRDDSVGELLKVFVKLDQKEIEEYNNLREEFNREVEWNIRGIDLYRRESKEGRYMVRMLCMRIKEFLMKASRVSGVVGEELAIMELYEMFSKRKDSVDGSFKAVCINWDYTMFRLFSEVSSSLDQLYDYYTGDKGVSIVLVKRRGRLLVMGLDWDSIESHRFCQDVLKGCNGKKMGKEISDKAKILLTAEPDVNGEESEGKGEDKEKPTDGVDAVDVRKEHLRYHEIIDKQLKEAKELQSKVFEDIKGFRQMLNELNQGFGGFEHLPFKVAPIPGEDRIRLYNFKWPFKIDVSQDMDGLIITAVRT